MVKMHKNRTVILYIYTSFIIIKKYILNKNKIFYKIHLKKY